MPETHGLDESKICAVISNLIDNAIEASDGLPDASITFALKQTGHYLFIECKNTVAYDILQENALMKTTKTKGDHGIGLQVVDDVVKKYDGMINFRMEELTFIVSAMLKIDGYEPDLSMDMALES
jgi:sensor histidine kinase regulating citrate/malate metabolism